MIRLAGFEPGRDIQIVFTGVRQGERMNESIFAADESVLDIGVDGVMAARTPIVERARLTRWLADPVGPSADEQFELGLSFLLDGIASSLPPRPREDRG